MTWLVGERGTGSSEIEVDGFAEKDVENSCWTMLGISDRAPA